MPKHTWHSHPAVSCVTKHPSLPGLFPVLALKAPQPQKFLSTGPTRPTGHLLLYTAIYLLKLLFHTCIFWLNISEEAVTLLQKCTYISLPITLFQYIFSFLTTENPTTNLETSDSAWIGLKTEKLNFCSHLYLTQSCAEKYLPATQGSRPPYPCCDNL